jgi:IS30 family transposase
MLKQKKGLAEIARILGVSRSTISREIKRGSRFVQREIKSNKKYVPLMEKVLIYQADYAQKVADKNSLSSSRHYLTFEEENYTEFIEIAMLRKENPLSPDAANALARSYGFKGVSTKTIYNWIHGGLLLIKTSDLLLCCKRKITPKVKEQKRKYGKSINLRPEVVKTREEFGHWEADSIVSCKGTTGHIISLVERQTRKNLLFLFPIKLAINMIQVLKDLKKEYGEYFADVFKTITFDNGSEFAYNDQMINYTDIYYARAYCSTDRASNENLNGMVRRFFKKGTDFNNISQDNVSRVSYYIDSIPRKIIQYKTSHRYFNEKLGEIVSVKKNFPGGLAPQETLQTLIN